MTSTRPAARYEVPPLGGSGPKFIARGFRSKAGLCALLVFVCLHRLIAGDWPQFRGPSASGVDDSAPAPTQWDVESGKNIRWKTPIPGLSHASPIIWGDRIYLISAERPGKAELKVGLYGDPTSADDQAPHEWRILALDRATGKILWNEIGHQATPRVKRHPKATHANSTPATDGKRIVAFFGSEGLFCFNATNGHLVWKKDLGPMDSGAFNLASAQWGFATSPIIHDGKVVVQCDVQTNSFLALVNLEDGKEIWRTPRTDVPTWSTPAIAKVGDQTRILINGWHHTGGYDFATGKEIWKLDGGGDVPVPTPIIAHDLSYFTSAHGTRVIRAIRLDAKGDITPPDLSGTNAAIVWAHPRQGNYMQTPIVVGDYVYGCFDNGVLTSFEAKTGKIAYSERLSSGSEGFTSSPVSDGRNLYFASETGKIYVVPIGPAFSISGIMRMGETCMASPALVNGTLYYRLRENLVAIGAQ